MKFSFSLLLAALLLISNQAYAERQQRPQEHGANERQQRQEPSPRAGHLSREERKELHQDVNDLSKEIYREKPNAERRSRGQNN